jgi:hypothetical protein
MIAISSRLQEMITQKPTLIRMDFNPDAYPGIFNRIPRTNEYVWKSNQMTSQIDAFYQRDAVALR